MSGIYVYTKDNRLVCAVCRGVDAAHAADCTVVALHTQLREVTGQLGMFVATLRETLDVMEELLRTGAPQEWRVIRGPD